MEEYLIVCLGLGLFKHIFLATPNKRWLWLHLRWRLVSRRFNRYILFSHGDRFTQTLLLLHSDLQWAGCRYGPCGAFFHGEEFPSTYVFPRAQSHYHAFVSPIQLFSLLCQSRTFSDVYTARMRMSSEYQPCFDTIVEEISEASLAKEILLWFQSLPRIQRKLPVKPADIDPDLWMGICLWETGRLGHSNTRLFDYPFCRSLCGLCWCASRKRRIEPDDPPDDPATEPRTIREHLCNPCYEYCSRVVSKAATAARWSAPLTGFLEF